MKLTSMQKEVLAFAPVFLAAALIAGFVDNRALSTGLLVGASLATFFAYRKMFGKGSWQSKFYTGLLIAISVVKFFWHS